MAVLPPGLFSMVTGWPMWVDSCWPMVRARKSEPPPAGYGTSQRMGLDG